MQGRSIRAMFAATCACAVALAGIACGGGSGSATTVTAPAGGAAPRSITKIAEVDHLIDLATGVDVIGLAGLTGYERVPCSGTAAGASGDPPLCRSNESDGETVEVLARSACDTGWVRPEAAPDAYRAALKNGTPQLFAVYVPKSDTNAFGADLGAQYVVVLSAGRRGDGTPAGVALHVKSGRVVWLQTECDQFLALVSQDVVASFVVDPIADAPKPDASPGVTIVPAP
jgi:hypothetical protein